MKTIKLWITIGLIAFFSVSGFAYLFDSVSNSYDVDIGKEVVKVSNISYSKGVISASVEKPVNDRGLTIQEVIKLKEASKTIQNDIDKKVNVYDKFVLVQKEYVLKEVIKEEEKDI